MLMTTSRAVVPSKLRARSVPTKRKNPKILLLLLLQLLLLLLLLRRLRLLLLHFSSLLLLLSWLWRQSAFHSWSRPRALEGWKGFGFLSGGVGGLELVVVVVVVVVVVAVAVAVAVVVVVVVVVVAGVVVAVQVMVVVVVVGCVGIWVSRVLRLCFFAGVGTSEVGLIVSFLFIVHCMFHVLCTSSLCGLDLFGVTLESECRQRAGMQTGR